MNGRRLRARGGSRDLEATLAGTTLSWTAGDDAGGAALTRVGASEWRVTDEDGMAHVVHVARSGATTWVHVAGRTHAIDLVHAARGKAASGSLSAPMTGRILEVLVAEGDHVAAGAPLVVLSAMKMRLEVTAPAAGIVRSIAHRAGELVEGGTQLVVLERVAEPAP